MAGRLLITLPTSLLLIMFNWKIDCHLQVLSEGSTTTSTDSEDFSAFNTAFSPQRVGSSRQNPRREEGGVVVWPGPRGRRDSLSSQDSSEYGTPPASPTPSSLYTADEGGAMVWIEGQGPTQTDRQVSDNVISKLVFLLFSLSF